MSDIIIAEKRKNASAVSANFMSHIKLAEIHRAREKVSILLWDRDLLRYNDTRGDAYDCPCLIWKSNKDKGGK